MLDQTNLSMLLKNKDLLKNKAYINGAWVDAKSAGVPDYVHESVDDAVTIEMPGKGRSLSVVVSCVMVLSEAMRQTRDL